MKKTIKIKYQVPAMSRNETFKFGEYLFKYDKNLNPIPVEVSSEVGELLLEMMDKSCRCHHRKPKRLFMEVK